MTRPHNWPTVSAGEVAEIKLGKMLDRAKHTTGKSLPYLRNINVRWGRFDTSDLYEMYFDAEEVERFSVRKGDLVVCEGGEPGRAAIWEDTRQAMFQKALHRVRPGDSVTAEWILVCLRHYASSGEINRFFSGTTIKHFTREAFCKLPIPLPPLEEQRRIVSRLDTLMERSRRARTELAEVPAQLAQARQSLLASAFRGDLTSSWRATHKKIEPIQKTLERISFESSRTGRSASDEKTPGVAGLSVGDIGPPPPSGWLRIPLLKVARLESGHTPSREHSEYWGGDVPWISIPDARRAHGKRINTTASFTNALGLANSAARLLPAGTVCLSRTASVGYVTIMEKPMATSQDFANWLCSDALLPDYLMMAFLAEGEHLLSFGRGSTHTTIYYPELKALNIYLPPVDEQREIVRRLDSALSRLDKVAAAQAAAIAELDRLDQALLARAFSGRLVPQSASASSGPTRPVLKPKSYLTQLVPALLRAHGASLTLDQINTAVAFLHSPRVVRQRVTAELGATEASDYFADWHQAYEDGALTEALNTLLKTGTLTQTPPRKGPVTLHLVGKLPPLAPEVEADARHLAAIVQHIPAEAVTAEAPRPQPGRRRQTVLTTA